MGWHISKPGIESSIQAILYTPDLKVAPEP